jgi:hypothetical protein
MDATVVMLLLTFLFLSFLVMLSRRGARTTRLVSRLRGAVLFEVLSPVKPVLWVIHD